MKKLTSNLWRVVGKATLALALATPVLVSSCVKFDDSQLKQEISDINDELSKINEKITNLETKLNNEVAALTALINGKTTVASCTTDEQTGVTTVVLSDGKTITVYPEAKMPDVSGITFLTTLEENNEYYWATCTVGGTPEFLLVDGEKVPVSVQPDLKIEDGKWFISVDGGKTWVETDIEEENEDDVVVFFTNVEEDDDYVYLTLASGTKIKVQKDKDYTFSILADNVALTYGNPTTYVNLDMEGVVDYTITEKPEGWKAVVEGSYLTITAPKEGVGETEGYIKMLATFETASPAIAKVYVSVEPDFVLSRKGSTISVTLAEINVGNFDYNGYVIGAMLEADYTPAAAVAFLSSAYSYGGASYDSLEESIEGFMEHCGVAYDPEESYVLFAANYANTFWGESYNEEDIKSLVYAPIKLNVEITPSLDNANLKLNFEGCEAVYAGIADAEYFVAEDLLGQFGSRWFTPVAVTEAYDGPIGLIAGGYESYLAMDTDYVFWVIVKNDNDEYTVEDIRTYEFSTFPLVLGGSLAAPEITLGEVTVSTVSAVVNAVEGCYMTYAYAYEKTASTMTEEELAKTVIAYGQAANNGPIEIMKRYLQPSTDIQICAVAIDELGNVGAMSKVDTKTLGLAFNEDIAVSVESVKVGPTSASVKLAFTGDVASIKYLYKNDEYGNESMENKMALDNVYATTVNVADLVDNTLELTGLSLGTKYYFFVMAYNEAGEYSHMAKTTFTPESELTFIKSSAANWAYGKPEISNEVWGENPWVKWGSTWYPQSTSLDVTVTLPAECKKAFVWLKEPDYLTSDTALTISDKAAAYGVPCEESGNLHLADYANHAQHIYVVWIDDNDEYHSYFEYVPTFPDKPVEE